MQIILNGESASLPDDCSVQGLLETFDLAGSRVAVELNLEILPASLHASQILLEGDRVEVIRAIGGG